MNRRTNRTITATMIYRVDVDEPAFFTGGAVVETCPLSSTVVVVSFHTSSQYLYFMVFGPAGQSLGQF